MSTPQPSRARALLVQVSVGVLLVFAIFFAGYFAGRSPLAAAQEATKAAQDQLTRANAQSEFDLARLQLYQAIDALDKRNFGTANDLLDQSGATLGKVNAVAAGIDPSGLSAAHQAIESANVEVAADLGSQQAGLRALVDQLNALAP